MAVVTFQRAGDAAVARAKYDGKIVDGREFFVLVLCFGAMVLTRWIGRPLKIEIVYDGGPPAGAGAVLSGQPSLLDRIGQIAGNPAPRAAKGAA